MKQQYRLNGVVYETRMFAGEALDGYPLTEE